MQNDAFFTPTHSLNATGAVCRIVKKLERGEVIVEFINGMQCRIAACEITRISKEYQRNGKNNTA
ncbi:hypothetical protein N9913_02460 [Porticoccaceae bacterium]|nr:hypothetical protein [Porticoccaceae bacterium]